MRVVAAALVLLGCGDNLRTPAGIHDGGRLFATWYAAGDAGLFRFWHDAKLDLDCSFQVGADGRYRCLPNDGFIGYGDPSCTQPIVSVMPCTDAPRFVVGPRHGLAACSIDDGASVYAVGDATRDQAYYFTDGADCRLGNNGSGGELHGLTEVSLDDFVAADLVRANTGAPIESYAFHADDGAIQNDSAWDTARGAECAISGNDPRCYPVEIALHYDDLWADATCATTHAAVDLGRVRPCARPTAVIAYTPTDEAMYLELGATLPTAYGSSAGTCAVAMKLANSVYYVEGAPIAATQFPVASRVLDGTGRVRALRYEHVPGSPLAIANTLYDNNFDEPCTAQPFVDGSIRCVPASALIGGGLYADAACTMPIAQLSSGPQPRVMLAPHADDSCGGVVRYESFAVGAPYGGPIYSTPGCRPFARGSSTTYVSAGDAIDLGELDER